MDWGLPAGIMGATVAAFETSSLEFAVGLNSALAGVPGVALGDALGRNIGNIALILGIALVFGAMHPDRRDIRRDPPVALITPLLVGLLSIDGSLSRVDGAVLLLVFAGWLATTVLQAKPARDAARLCLARTRA